MKIRQKRNLTKVILSKATPVLIVALLLSPALATLFPASASAANSGTGTFEYNDVRASHVLEITDDGTKTYTRSSGGDGYYNGGKAEGFDGCTAIIHINSNKYDGSTAAQWYASCLGGAQQTPTQPGKKSITIAKAKNYTGDWVDHNHITVDGVTYFDNHTDNNLNFIATNQNNGCDPNVIKGFDHSDGGDIANAPAAELTINAPFSSTNTKCTSKTVPVYFNNTQNFARYFQWIDGGTIRTTDGKTMTFVQNNGKGPFVDSSGSDCKSTLVPDPGDPGHGTLIIRYDKSNPFDNGWGKVSDADFDDQGGCQVSDPIKNVNIANVSNKSKAAGTGDVGIGGGDGAELGCDGSSSPLTWIICPVINDLLVPAITATDNLITEQMTIPANNIFCSTGDTCGAYYTAWSTFRNLALGLLVVAGLIVIIGQAVGLEILDAYTIRKVLPRLLIAAIGITLSWALMSFAVTLSNDLGFGIRHLITAPFSGLSLDLSFDLSDNPIINTFFGGAVGAGAAVAAVPIWIAAGGLGVLLSYIVTAGLAVLVAVLVLILRQIAVIMLILISPIAIVAYVLPNTQRVFRLWWESFSKALLMFPLIAAFIAAGRVFAAISLSGAGGGGDVFHGIIGFVAYFAPYFLIPMTFRMSGSMMSGLGGFVQQRTQGISNGLSGYRSNQRKERVARARSGGLYRGANKFTRGLNTISDYTLDADENLAYDFGTGNRLGKVGRGKYNPIGYAGKKLLGRTGEELAEKIAGAYTDHTAKGAEKAKMHYTGAWAGLGLLGDKRAGQGLTAAGRAAIDKEFGTEFDPETGRATAWRAPANGDHEGLVKMGTMLQQYGTDGSHAQMAGQQILAKAGELSSFGLHEDTQRATLQSVSAFQAARDGKLNPEDLAAIYNSKIEGTHHGSVERAVAEREMSQLEEVATQQRHDLRRGKGIRIGSDGKAYSVYSHKKIKNADGTETEAYKSDKAKESLMTAKANPAGMGKGEFWDVSKDSWLHFASEKGADGELTTDAKELRKFIVQSEGIWGSGDPGAKAKVVDIKDKLGIDWKEEQGYQRGADPSDVQANAGSEVAAEAARKAAEDFAARNGGGQQ